MPFPSPTPRVSALASAPVATRAAAPAASPASSSAGAAPSPLDAPEASLAQEIRDAFDFAAAGRETLAFFGSARVKCDEPLFAEGMDWGRAVGLMNFGALAGSARLGALAGGAVAGSEVGLGARVVVLAAEAGRGLAEASAPGDRSVRARTAERLIRVTTTTGAGPGMMEAVPLGVLSARERVEADFPEHGPALRALSQTQGSRILLPFEQETSKTIERIARFRHFIPRRLALSENAAGIVAFPGGFGTVNEVLEVLRSGRPVVLHGADFWGDIVERLASAWRGRGLVDEASLAQLQIASGPGDGLEHLLRTMPELPRRPLRETGVQLAGDAERTLSALAGRPPAVTFLGGRALTRDDATLVVARHIAQALAEAGIPRRVGGPGAVLDAVRVGGRSDGGEAARIELVVLAGSAGDQASSTDLEVVAEVHGTPIQKLGLYEGTSALVALPGGVGTLDEVFEVATLMQTGKIARRPLVLVGREFWSPILEALGSAMRRPGALLIGPEDMGLFHVVDTAAEALGVLSRTRAE